MKRLIGVVKAFLFTMCLVGMFSMNVQASEVLIRAWGEWDNLSWKVEEGVLTISGEGDMTSAMDYDEYPWYEYRSQIKTIIIKDGVTSLGEGAFWSSTVESVNIPEGCRDIQMHAFGNCLNLKEVNLSGKNREIFGYAFWGCNSLSNNMVNEILTHAFLVSGEAFANCSSITSVTIPKNNLWFSGNPFVRCENLAEITADSALYWTGVDNNILYVKFVSNGEEEVVLRCVAPKGIASSVEIPVGVTEIGDGAFYQCTNLTKVTIPDSVTTIDDDAFHSCAALDTVIMGEGVTTIDSYAFADCSNLTEITIPTSVTTISYSAFMGTGITEVTIPKGVTTINDRAFGYSSYNVKINDFVIRGFTGSAAETYAINNNITFVSMGNVEDTRIAIESFVTRMYEQCLSRDPDQAGLDGWAGQLENGNMNGAQIAEQFVFSNEMLEKNLSNEEFVNVLYRSMMGREADAAGRTGWVNELSNGYMTRSQVTKAFVESTEFTNICTSYGITRGTYDASIAPIEHFVTRFYTLCLERNADQAGLYGWVNNLKNQYMNGAQIADAFIFSDEFVNKNVSDEKYIELLYNTLLGRPSDANGKAGWVGELQGGHMTREGMMKAFIESTEFTGICETYGITRGSL